MGIICPLSPEIRAINKKNHELQRIVKEQLEGLNHYGFSQSVIEAINRMPTRYMYNEGILQDAQKLHEHCKNSISRRTDNSSTEQIEDELKSSCLILENEENLPMNVDDKESPPQMGESFHNNVKKNESLVVQINIIYKKQQIKLSEYSQALHLFLKWANMYQEHTIGGFLKPIYRKFYDFLIKIPMTQLDTIIDQVCVFVQFMVSIITEIYGLKLLASAQTGRLIKNQNVYNLIMSYMFKRTKIKRFLSACFNHRDRVKIDKFEKQLHLLSKKPTHFFGIGKKFALEDGSMTESEITKNTEANLYVQPYNESLKLVDQLCKSGSPVTKLKTIIAISKQIIKDIQQYYQSKGREAPDVDPDNLSSIVMYLLAKNGNKFIYQQLKIVEHFTTTNCLNCISGYHLNVFIAAIESILEIKQP